jgi:hypothetical protein
MAVRGLLCDVPMSNHSRHDRWLLPRWQTEYPARERLPEATLHARRESTFLVLAATFFVAATAVLLLGVGRVVDLAPLAARWLPNVHVPFALTAPLAALPFAVSCVASAFVAYLFARRRAAALVWVAAIASAGVIGLVVLGDLIDHGNAVATSTALAAGVVLGHACNVVGIAATRHARGVGLFVRWNLVSLFAHAVGWVAFAGALEMSAPYVVAPIARETLIGLAVCGALASWVCALVLSVPSILVARGLAVVLRVGRELYDDELVEQHEDDDRAHRQQHEPVFAEGSVASRMPPYSSAEMRFFADGDAHAD